MFLTIENPERYKIFLSKGNQFSQGNNVQDTTASKTDWIVP
jgi:hypothetical protein